MNRGPRPRIISRRAPDVARHAHARFYIWHLSCHQKGTRATRPSPSRSRTNARRDHQDAPPPQSPPNHARASALPNGQDHEAGNQRPTPATPTTRRSGTPWRRTATRRTPSRTSAGCRGTLKATPIGIQPSSDADDRSGMGDPVSQEVRRESKPPATLPPSKLDGLTLVATPVLLGPPLLFHRFPGPAGLQYHI